MARVTTRPLAIFADGAGAERAACVAADRFRALYAGEQDCTPSGPPEEHSIPEVDRTRRGASGAGMIPSLSNPETTDLRPPRPLTQPPVLSSFTG